MKYILRIHLENKEDVIRDIEIKEDHNLEDLHHAIIDSFNLENNQMASFYKTNDNFELLEEIPIFNIDVTNKQTSNMQDILISSVFVQKENHLLYVYDFLKMWRFLITFHSTSDNKIKETLCINKIGKIPQEAPEFRFEENLSYPEEEEFNEYEEY